MTPDLLARALVRWQHSVGPFWPYVCAAPFLGTGDSLRLAASIPARPIRWSRYDAGSGPILGAPVDAAPSERQGSAHSQDVLFEVVLADLPMTPSGKVQKFLLRKTVLEIIGLADVTFPQTMSVATVRQSNRESRPNEE